MLPIRDKQIIGRAEHITFPELHTGSIHARIDTGARTSALWARAWVEDGVLQVVLFGRGHPFYTGKPVAFRTFDQVAVASSTGHIQVRYKIRLLVELKGRRIRAWFTLADRSTQVYPVLIGRNVLLGKFVVDVKEGHILRRQERMRKQKLRLAVEEQKGET